MALRDEVREQQNKLKGKSFKEKMSYFWDYYKVHTFVALFVIVTGSIFIHDVVTSKDYAFSATLLNAHATDSQAAMETEFAEYVGIDTEEYTCFIDTSSTLSYDAMTQMDLAVSQRIVALTQTNGMDVFVSDFEPFSNYAQSQMFRDLREELTAEEFEKFKDRFFYIDAATIDANNSETNYDENGISEIVPEDINHTDPSLMEDPVPVGIFLTDSPKLKELGCYSLEGQTPIFGFVYSSADTANSHQFLKYLTE